jgi:hypothetical protein
MQNPLDHEYTKNNIKYLLLKSVFVGSKYYPILRDYLGDVSYKFLDSNRIVLVDEGQSAIIQLENFCNLFTIKVLYSIEGVDLEGIIGNIIEYIIDLIKLSSISVNIANTIGYRVYIYHYLNLSNFQFVRTTSVDIFENPIGFESNEFIKNLQFDNNYNIPLVDFQRKDNFSLFSSPNIPLINFQRKGLSGGNIYQQHFPKAFSPTSNHW